MRNVVGKIQHGNYMVNIDSKTVTESYLKKGGDNAWGHIIKMKWEEVLRR